MVSRIVATFGTVVGMWLFLGFVSLMYFGPSLIGKYAPPITHFQISAVRYDEDGAMYFKPTFHKRWCEYQPGSASWHSMTAGVSERVSLTVPNRPHGGQNRAPGTHRAPEWKVDIFATPGAVEQYGLVTHKCLLFLKVETKIGPWPVPLPAE